jgi:hypothetical protein
MTVNCRVCGRGIDLAHAAQRGEPDGSVSFAHSRCELTEDERRAKRQAIDAWRRTEYKKWEWP